MKNPFKYRNSLFVRFAPITILVILLIGVFVFKFVFFCLILYNHEIIDFNNNVDYYGCPNSKRVRKLNMRKKRIL